MQPDPLAVQEVGDPEAALDLAGRLAGDWTVETADPDDRGIRAGSVSRSAMTNVEQVRDVPHGIGPVRVSDDLSTINRLGGRGRGRPRVRDGAAGAVRVRGPHPRVRAARPDSPVARRNEPVCDHRPVVVDIADA